MGLQLPAHLLFSSYFSRHVGALRKLIVVVHGAFVHEKTTRLGRRRKSHIVHVVMILYLLRSGYSAKPAHVVDSWRLRAHQETHQTCPLKVTHFMLSLLHVDHMLHVFQP